MTSSTSSAIVLKIHNGTRADAALCKSCRNALITKGNNGQHVIYCSGGGGANPIRISFDVSECNRYFNATQPTLYEMEEIAWRLITKNAGRQIGFVNPATFRKIQDEEGATPNAPPQPRW